MERPAIVEAAANPVTTELEHLIDIGHDVNQADSLGYTALHIAAGFGNDAAVRCLLAADADVNAVSKAGWTPLHRAALSGRLNSVKLLVQAGALITARTRKNETPLDMARIKNHSLVTVFLQKALLRQQAQQAITQTPRRPATAPTGASAADGDVGAFSGGASAGHAGAGGSGAPPGDAVSSEPVTPLTPRALLRQQRLADTASALELGRGEVAHTSAATPTGTTARLRYGVIGSVPRVVPRAAVPPTASPVEVAELKRQLGDARRALDAERALTRALTAQIQTLQRALVQATSLADELVAGAGAESLLGGGEAPLGGTPSTPPPAPPVSAPGTGPRTHRTPLRRAPSLPRSPSAGQRHTATAAAAAPLSARSARAAQSHRDASPAAGSDVAASEALATPRRGRVAGTPTGAKAGSTPRGTRGAHDGGASQPPPVQRLRTAGSGGGGSGGDARTPPSATAPSAPAASGGLLVGQAAITPPAATAAAPGSAPAPSAATGRPFVPPLRLPVKTDSSAPSVSGTPPRVPPPPPAPSGTGGAAQPAAKSVVSPRATRRPADAAATAAAAAASRPPPASRTGVSAGAGAAAAAAAAVRPGAGVGAVPSVSMIPPPPPLSEEPVPTPRSSAGAAAAAAAAVTVSPSVDTLHSPRALRVPAPSGGAARLLLGPAPDAAVPIGTGSSAFSSPRMAPMASPSKLDTPLVPRLSEKAAAFQV